MRTIFHIGASGSLEGHILGLLNKNAAKLSELGISWIAEEPEISRGEKPVRATRAVRRLITASNIEAQVNWSDVLVLTNHHLLSSPAEIFSARRLYRNARAVSSFINLHLGDTDLNLILEVFPVIEMIGAIRDSRCIEDVSGQTEAELLAMSWVDVVEDVRAGCPSAKIYVLDGRFSAARIVRVLRELLKIENGFKLGGEFSQLRAGIKPDGVGPLNKLIAKVRGNPSGHINKFVELLNVYRNESTSRDVAKMYDLSEDFVANSLNAYLNDLEEIRNIRQVYVI